MKQLSGHTAAPRISVIYMMLTIIFCTCLIVSNITEIKTIDVGPLTITAGVITFPITYIINDCIVEVYGFSRARLMIWLGFAVNMLVSMLLQLAIIMPGSADWTHQEAMTVIFGAVPRIFTASFIAFICGSMVNAVVMARMKARDGNRRFSLRAVVSTVCGEGTDSLLFFPIAFAGTLPPATIVSLIVTQTLLKTLYEIAILPVTVRAVRRLRRLEGDNAGETDTATSYSWIPRL